MFIKFSDLYCIIPLTLSISTSPEIKVNETMVYKLNLGILGLMLWLPCWTTTNIEMLSNLRQFGLWVLIAHLAPFEASRNSSPFSLPAGLYYIHGNIGLGFKENTSRRVSWKQSLTSFTAYCKQGTAWLTVRSVIQFAHQLLRYY